MLRVRPVHCTSDLDGCAAQLEAEGLRCVENHGDWRLFDSGNGKVGLHRAEAGSATDGYTVLGFEVRDHEIFVRRTLADGTHAELADPASGGGARVTAPDGFILSVNPVTDLSLADPESRLSVTARWLTPDPAAANKVLADMGARHVQDYPGGGALFSAKNGGFVATMKGEANVVELEIGNDAESES